MFKPVISSPNRLLISFSIRPFFIINGVTAWLSCTNFLIDSLDSCAARVVISVIAKLLSTLMCLIVIVDELLDRTLDICQGLLSGQIAIMHHMLCFCLSECLYVVWWSNE